MTDLAGDDDWETAELATTLQTKLKTVEMQSDSKPVKTVLSKPKIVIKGHADDVNTSKSHGPSDTLTTRTDNETLDSAILSALESHRGRMQVVEIESRMLNYVTKSAHHEIMSNPPIHNRYWRLINFRIADRFCLSRRVADDSGTIIFYKTQDTSLPKKLIMDMDLDKEYQQYNELGGREGYIPRPSSHSSLHSDEDNDTNNHDDNTIEKDNTTSNGSSTASPPTASGPRKVLMMRRPATAANDRNNGKGKGKDKKGEESVSDKAAAYAAARARIMGKREEYDGKEEVVVEQKALLVEGRERGGGVRGGERERRDERYVDNNGSREGDRDGHNGYNGNNGNDPNYYPPIPMPGGMPVGVYPAYPNIPPTVFQGMAIPPGGVGVPGMPVPGVPGAVFPYPVMQVGGIYPYPTMPGGVIPTGYPPQMVPMTMTPGGGAMVGMPGMLPPGGTMPTQGYSNTPPAVREQRGPPARAPQQQHGNKQEREDNSSSDEKRDEKRDSGSRGEGRGDGRGARGRGGRRGRGRYAGYA